MWRWASSSMPGRCRSRLARTASPASAPPAEMAIARPPPCPTVPSHMRLLRVALCSLLVFILVSQVVVDAGEFAEGSFLISRAIAMTSLDCIPSAVLDSLLGISSIRNGMSQLKAADASTGDADGLQQQQLLLLRCMQCVSRVACGLWRAGLLHELILALIPELVS